MTTYTFSLRDNLRSSDGTDLIADDVQWSWTRAMANGSERAVRALGNIVGADAVVSGKQAEISGVKVIDDSTIQIILKVPDPYFPSNLAKPATFILSRDNVARWDPLWSPDPGQSEFEPANYEAPVGTGPFKASTFEFGERYVLTPNAFHHFDVPRFRSITLDDDFSSDSFSVGGIDVTIADDTLIAELELGETPARLAAVDSPSALRYLALNASSPLFSDLDVGRALINASGLTDPFTDRLSLVPERASTADALAKLRETSITHRKIHGDPLFPEMSSALDAWESGLGVEIDTEYGDRAWYEERLRNGEIDLLFGVISPEYPSELQVFGQPSIVEQLARLFPNAMPNSLWAEVGRMVADARAEPDRALRDAAYRAAGQFIVEQALVVPMPFPAGYIPWMTRPHVHGFGFSPYGGSRFASVWLDPVP